LLARAWGFESLQGHQTFPLAAISQAKNAAMKAFYHLEQWVLQRIAAEYPDIAVDLLEQFDAATIVSRENTGHGFFTNFTVDRTAAKPVACERVIGNLWAKVEGMEDTMNFLVFLEDGFARMLEGAGIDDDVSEIDFSRARINPLEHDH
jgi:hypothetical protein